MIFRLDTGISVLDKDTKTQLKLNYGIKIIHRCKNLS